MIMLKRKNTPGPKNDTKIAAIILVLFVVGIILFLLHSKGKETPVEKAPVAGETGDMYLPNDNIRPVETQPVLPVRPQPIESIPGSGGKIAIIIDDWGQSLGNCKYLKEIPEPLAVSILPGLRHTKDVAACAGLNHKLTMLHLPLEAMHNFDFYPPDYVIKTTMSPELVTKIVEDDLAQLPSIEGVNNHMGSKATADKALMRIILRMLKKRNLFFVDSMTSHYSVSAELAEEMGLAYDRRDVFLDNVNTRDAIIKQFTLLAKEARHRGYAVAIGHDRHLTMQVIKDEIPLLEKQGFQIVSIKTLLKKK
jgi:polysaccharide deacetylase 2 family uncharacterized protein YibQ